MTKDLIGLHAEDHVLGGPDPHRPTLPFMFAHDAAIGQTVTADDELEFSQAKTNDPYSEDNPTGTFAIDLDTNAGILIYRQGLYMVLADVHYAAGSIGISRTIYSAWSRLSSGALAGVGNEMNPGIGIGQAPGGISEVTTTAKSRLTHYAITLLNVIGLDPLTEDPFRAAVILQHNGSNYTTGNGSNTSSLTVVRLAGLGETVDFTP